MENRGNVTVFPLYLPDADASSPAAPSAAAPPPGKSVPGAGRTPRHGRERKAYLRSAGGVSLPSSARLTIRPVGCRLPAAPLHERRPGRAEVPAVVLCADGFGRFSALRSGQNGSAASASVVRMLELSGAGDIITEGGRRGREEREQHPSEHRAPPICTLMCSQQTHDPRVFPNRIHLQKCEECSGQ